MFRVKSWFVQKSFSQQERMIIEAGDMEIVSESEKAYQLKFVSDYGTITKWVPKSCTETFEQAQATYQAEQSRMQAGLNKHQARIEWAKANGIKISGGRIKAETLSDKLLAAGLELPKELQWT